MFGRRILRVNIHIRRFLTWSACAGVAILQARYDGERTIPTLILPARPTEGWTSHAGGRCIRIPVCNPRDALT